VGDILDPKERHTKFLNVDFIGLLFLGMHMNFAKDVKHARREVIYLEGIKQLCIMFMHVRFVMYQVLILWDLFPPSFNFTYILMLVDYVFKWIEAVATRAYHTKTMVKHVQSLILYRYGVPEAIINDRGTPFCNRTLGALLAKHHVTHKVSTSYHP